MRVECEYNLEVQGISQPLSRKALREIRKEGKKERRKERKDVMVGGKGLREGRGGERGRRRENE